MNESHADTGGAADARGHRHRQVGAHDQVAHGIDIGPHPSEHIAAPQPYYSVCS